MRPPKPTGEGLLRHHVQRRGEPEGKDHLNEMSFN